MFNNQPYFGTMIMNAYNIEEYEGVHNTSSEEGELGISEYVNKKLINYNIQYLLAKKIYSANQMIKMIKICKCED